jgi:hypothetical protein
VAAVAGLVKRLPRFVLPGHDPVLAGRGILSHPLIVKVNQ